MKVEAPRKARVLLYDIETAPNLAYVWGKYEQDVIAYEEQWYMLCFAYKWLGERKTHIVALPDFPLYKKDPTNDYEVIKKLHELFDEADVIIAHNGDSFDQKKSHARMLVHGMAPPSPYRQIDTRKVARKYFNFNSNKLNDLGELLKVGVKAETGGFKLWLGCMNGVKAAWSTMKKYNKQDVVLLEQVYLKMRGWIHPHPAMNLMEDRLDACPNCGHNVLIKRGTYYNKVSKIQVWQCKGCGAHPRSRVVEARKESVSFVS